MMRFPWLLSLTVGFLSLSQEILWMRYFSFVNMSVPKSFSFVLAFFLAGIAMGAIRGKELCGNTDKLYTASGLLLIGAGILDMLGPMAAAMLPKPGAFVVPLIYVCAVLKGMIFPVAHHLGSVPVAGQVGKSVSRVYFMNIIGSTLGPLVTGFWLLDHFSLQTCMQLMGWLTAALGVVCLAREQSGRFVATAALAPICLLIMFLQPGVMAEGLACRTAEGNKGPAPVKNLIETRTGIIHALPSDHGGGDYTLGGNVYDGRDNINPRTNSNGLERLFILAALQPAPAEILVIGMSSGAWTRILTGFPAVKNIDVVEINPGYLPFIRNYPEISPVLGDPRVHIHIDDGRRWLKRETKKKYDLIVMNTSFHWRAYSTNLLSAEFLTILRSRLNPGGVLTYNSTDSPDVLKTAETVFPFAFRYMNFVVAGDEDFRPLVASGRERLLAVQRDGKPLFDDRAPADRAFIDVTLAVPFRTSAEDPNGPGEVITDWNMITEFKHGPLLLAACD
ncbi:MAG TPA: hypothetical protein VEF76_13080 [Patescibacteria group bacterium]|nr:hypothetical protein [Patescibacteria group bacterium]